MKRNICGVLFFTLIFTLLTSIITFAANYILQDEKIPTEPEGYFEMKDTTKNIYDRSYNSFYYWNANGSPYVNLQLDTDRLNIDTTQIYTIDTEDLGDGCYGLTGFGYNGEIYIFINTTLLDNEYSDIDQRNRAYEYTICHEVGHCFGLGDLGFFDTWNAVMSEWANKVTLYQPTSNDVAGVIASYGL